MTELRLGIDAWGMSNGALYSGFGQYTALLLRHLPAAGVTVAAYGAPGEARPSWLPAEVSWRVPGRSRFAKLGAIESRLYLLDRMVAGDGIDVFHAPAVHVRPSFPPVPRLRCPVVATVHDVIPLTHYSRRLPLRLQAFYGWNLRRALGADRVITVSRTSRDEIVRVTGTRADRLTVIPNAIEFGPNRETAPLSRLGLTPPYVLFAGSYEPRKNLAGALAAFALLRSEGLRHTFVAVVERSSGHAAAIHRLIEEKALTDCVLLVHDLEESDLRALYTHADLLLFPSLAEGFGFPPLQAAACGVPVVASQLEVLRETMGDAAVLVDCSRPELIAKAAAAVLADGSARERVAVQAQARLEAFDVGTFVRRHVGVYEDAATD